MLQEFRSQKLIWDKAKTTFYEPIQANSGDSNGRKLIVKILNNGVEEDLTGASLSLSWQAKGESNGLDVFTPVDITKGEFEIYYTTGMLSNFGNLTASLVLADASGVIESLPLIITVYKSNVDSEAVQSDNSFTALTQALVQVNNLETTYAPRLTTAEQDIVTNHNQVMSHLADFASLLAGGDVLTATLQNGWGGTVQYSKNDLGQVHVWGDLSTIGTLYRGTAIASLPLKYRTKSITGVSCYVGSPDVRALLGLYMHSNGGIYTTRALEELVPTGTIYFDILFQS